MNMTASCNQVGLLILAWSSLLLTACGEQGDVVAPPANQVPRSVISTPSRDTTVTLGDAVIFQGTATDTDGAITAHAWSFGDGYTSTVERPGAHTYTSEGVYTATYQVTDDDGAVSVPDTVFVTVQVPLVLNSVSFDYAGSAEGSFVVNEWVRAVRRPPPFFSLYVDVYALLWYPPCYDPEPPYECPVLDPSLWIEASALPYIEGKVGSLSIRLPWEGSGTYFQQEPNPNSFMLFVPSEVSCHGECAGTQYLLTAGELVLDAPGDGRISGTFHGHFTAYDPDELTWDESDTIDVTNGEFSLRLWRNPF